VRRRIVDAVITVFDFNQPKERRVDNQDNVEITQETQDFASETLKGDVRDWLLDRVKHIQKPWQQMSEQEQRDMIFAAEDAAGNLVRNAVRIIAAEGRKVITAQLEQVTVKDGIKAVCTLSKHDPFRHELVDAQGKDVLIVVADASAHMGQQDDAKPDNLREPGLPLDNDQPVFDNTSHG
jgi:hypothetical protein